MQPINERLAEAPQSAFEKMFDIRISPPVTLRMAIAMVGRHSPRTGWIVFFGMFELAAIPKGGTAGDANLLGF